MFDVLDRMYNSASCDKWYKGKELVNILDKEIDKTFKERYVINDLLNYLKNSSKDICALHGLRRTGKSVLMRQAMRRLLNDNVSPEEIAYITFSVSTNFNDNLLIQQIRNLKESGVKYFFIDEISYIIDDYECNSLNLLVDEIVNIECRIVITGTFSYAINLLMYKVLFDRVKVIDTNYFSFKESNEIFGFSMDKFIEMGGCINDVADEQYIKSFVVDNIVDSLVKSEKLYEMAYFIKKVDESKISDKEVRVVLSILFIRIIDFYNMVHLFKSIRKESFTYPDIGRLISIIKDKSRYENCDIDSTTIGLLKENLNNKINNYIGLLNGYEIPEVYFKELLKILKFIGLIEPITLDNYYGMLFLNNNLRYRLCKTIVEETREDVDIYTKGKFNSDVALSIIKGMIFENSIP